MTRAPDLLEPLIAFRSWRVVDGELASPFLGQRWDAGVAVARCHRAAPEELRFAADLLPFEHDSPHPDCRCGIHAYLEPRSALSGVDYRGVLGLVTVWGRVEVHPAGLRAEFAQIQALGTSRRWSSWHRADVVALAERLGLALVDEQALGAVAPDFGSSLPASLRVAQPRR